MDTRSIPDELAASVQHLESVERTIAALRAKVRRLEDVRKETLGQIAVGAKRYADGKDWGTDAYLLFDLYEQLNTAGFFTAWNAVGLPHPARLRADVERIERHRPNDPTSGGWVGEWDGRPIGNYPGPGTPVVYVLYGPDASPVYCGSSQQFAKRLDVHHRSGKQFVAWRAVQAASREAAYELEDQLLKQHCPPLNMKAGR